MWEIDRRKSEVSATRREVFRVSTWRGNPRWQLLFLPRDSRRIYMSLSSVRFSDYVICRDDTFNTSASSTERICTRCYCFKRAARLSLSRPPLSPSSLLLSPEILYSKTEIFIVRNRSVKYALSLATRESRARGGGASARTTRGHIKVDRLENAFRILARASIRGRQGAAA